MFSDRVVNGEPEYVVKEKEAIVCGLDVEQLAVGVRWVVVRLKQKYDQLNCRFNDTIEKVCNHEDFSRIETNVLVEDEVIFKNLSAVH